jgi:hypothetical protein
MTYILILVILALLYIMNGMNEDRKDADRMFNKVINEFKPNDCDSIKALQKRQVDSLNKVIEWYRNESKPKQRPTDTRKKNTEAKVDKPAAAATQDTL